MMVLVGIREEKYLVLCNHHKTDNNFRSRQLSSSCQPCLEWHTVDPPDLILSFSLIAFHILQVPI